MKHTVVHIVFARSWRASLALASSANFIIHAMFYGLPPSILGRDLCEIELGDFLGLTRILMSFLEVINFTIYELLRSI